MRRTLAKHQAALKSANSYAVAFPVSLLLRARFATPLYYFMTDKLKFSQAYIGILGSITSAGWIAGALVASLAAAGEMTSKALLYLSIVLGTAAAASFLLLTDEVTAASSTSPTVPR